jgi:hypothetical protein
MQQRPPPPESAALASNSYGGTRLVPGCMGGEGAAAAEGVRGMRIVVGFGKDVAYICWGLYWVILGHIRPHIFLQIMSIPGPRGAPRGKTPPRPCPVAV